MQSVPLTTFIELVSVLGIPFHHLVKKQTNYTARTPTLWGYFSPLTDSFGYLAVFFLFFVLNIAAVQEFIRADRLLVFG